MAKSLLYKSQSGVFALLYTLMFFFFASFAYATDPTASALGSLLSGGGQGMCNAAGLKFLAKTKCGSEEKPQEATAANQWEKCFNDLEKQHCSSTSNRSCEGATKEWETARKEFVAACSAAKVPSGGGTSGDFACAKNMRECTHCDAEEDSRPSTAQCESSDADTDSSSASSDTNILNTITGQSSGALQMIPDIDADRQRFAHCPALAAAELKTWQDEYKDAKKIVEDLQTKITKLTEELDTIKIDAQKKNTELQDKAEEVQADAKKSAKEATQKLEEAEKKMAEDIESINGEIAKENAGLRQLDIGLVQAETALSDRISQLNLSCHASALQRVDAERTQQLKEMQNSTYSAGDMNNLMNGVGLSSRQKNQIKVDEYYIFCQKDRAYKATIESAQKALAIAKQQAAEGRRSINDRITALDNKIKTIKTTDSYKAKERTYDRLTEIQEIMDKELNKLNREKTQSEQQFTTRYASKAKELQQEQARLAEEEQYLKQKKQYLAMKTKMSKGISNTSEDKVNDAMAKYLSVASAGKRVMRDCDCNGAGASQGICGQALAYLTVDAPSDELVKKAVNQASRSPAPDRPVGAAAPAPATPGRAPTSR